MVWIRVESIWKHAILCFAGLSSEWRKQRCRSEDLTLQPHRFAVPMALENCLKLNRCQPPCRRVLSALVPSANRGKRMQMTSVKFQYNQQYKFSWAQTVEGLGMLHLHCGNPSGDRQTCLFQLFKSFGSFGFGMFRFADTIWHDQRFHRFLVIATIWGPRTVFRSSHHQPRCQSTMLFGSQGAEPSKRPKKWRVQRVLLHGSVSKPCTPGEHQNSW